MRRNTLRQRLILINLIITGAALLLASTLMLAVEVTSLMRAMVKDVIIKANITGNQCSAALLFNVKRDAEEMLGALRADKQIEDAAVYTKKGALFASYRSGNGTSALPAAPPPEDGHRFTLTRLSIAYPILLHEERIGTIVIRTNMDNLSLLLIRYAVAAVIVLLVSIVAAYALVSKLQRGVTGPVSGLVEVMDRISRERDFGVRAAVAGPDELITLANGFNEMLAVIQTRDRELEEHRKDLEDSLSNLRRSSLELHSAYKKLEMLDKLKSDFLSTVSHELRTPLTSIKAFIELVLLKPNMDPDRKTRLLQTINDESDRLGRLINDLLDLSRIEAGMMQWKDKRVSLDNIIQRSVAGIAPIAQKKGMLIHAPRTVSLPLVLVDEDRMVQVVTNILSNAVKFTPVGGNITIEARQETAPQNRLVVEISDSGPGIPPAELEFIFDKFHRADDGATSSIEGTGLGLSIVRQIIEHYGGTIWAANRPGGGSVFTFTVPVLSATGSGPDTAIGPGPA